MTLEPLLFGEKMPASVNDKFRKGYQAFSTTLASTKASGATSMSLSSATGIPTDTALDFTVGRVDSSGTSTPATKVVYKGTLSGTTVSNLTVVEGTDQSHAAGTVVELTYTASTHNDAVDGILVDHSQSGGHEIATNYDSSNPTLETQKWVGVASAVNEPQTTNSATGNPVLYGVSGGDTNINLTLVPKGTGTVKTSPDNRIDWTALPLGSVVQVVNTNFSAVATGTTVLPFDDTMPQNTEGNEFMTRVITPKAATNILVIDCVLVLAASIATRLSAALFQDTIVDALAAVAEYNPTANTEAVIRILHTMTAGTTSATTFKVRAGPDSAGTMTFNGSGGVRIFGAITKSAITITEYKA